MQPLYQVELHRQNRQHLRPIGFHSDRHPSSCFETSSKEPYIGDAAAVPDQGLEPQFLRPERSVLPLDESGMGSGSGTRTPLAGFKIQRPAN